MMTIVERADFLKDVEMFSLVRTEYLAKIAAVTHEEVFAEGHELFQQGSVPGAVYLVVEGEIRAVRDGATVSVARRGDAVGAVPALDRKPSLVAAVTAAPTRVLVVENAVFDDLMQDNPAVALGIIRFATPLPLQHFVQQFGTTATYFPFVLSPSTPFVLSLSKGERRSAQACRRNERCSGQACRRANAALVVRQACPERRRPSTSSGQAAAEGLTTSGNIAVIPNTRT